MSAHEAAVKAVATALCDPVRNQWRGADGSIPPDPDAWHYETDGTCSYDCKKAARIALAALAASAEVRTALVAAMAECFVEGWYGADYDEGKIWARPGQPTPPDPKDKDEASSLAADSFLAALAGTEEAL